jgi:hypothetical protein
MKKLPLVASLAASLAVGGLLGSLVFPAAATSSTSSTATTLERGNWAPRNFDAINALIAKHSSDHSPDDAAAAYAVFDWDNTSIINDVTDKLFLYQIDPLAYRLTPDEFAQNLVRTVPGGLFKESIVNDAKQRVSLEDIAADISADYTYLHANYQGLAGTKTLEEITNTAQFQDFKAKLYFLLEAIIDTHGKEIAYPWEIFFVDNMTEEEFRVLAQDSIRHQMGAEISKHTVQSPASLPGRAGVVSISYADGLRTVPEIYNLMHTFLDNGVDVYVVSAGFEPLVEAIASSPDYAYNVPVDKVFGLRLEQDPNGAYLPEYKNDYPFTYGSGKPEVIHKEISRKHEGRDPVFVAGDSGSDIGNFTELPGMELGVVVNYLATGELGKISKEAANAIETDNTRFVLQGVDENIGVWQPTEKTRRIGATEAVLTNPKA